MTDPRRLGVELATVQYEVAGGIATITMDRPERRNALDDRLLADLDLAFDAAARDPAAQAVVLAGNGPSFCAGYDLGGSDYTTPPDGGWAIGSGLERLRGIEERYRRIWDLPKPTIARVHGHAIAAGCYLQMLCDISVAADDAVLGHPAVRFGGVSSMPLWQLLLGPKVARYLLFTGRTVSGAEAAQIGLVSVAVPLAALDATVRSIAEDCAAIPAEGARHHKETLNTDLEIMGLGALFRYHGQMNALGRLRPGAQVGDRPGGP